MAEAKNVLTTLLDQIERDKGVKKEELLKMIEASLVSAYRKHYGKNINVIATIDPETAAIKAYVIKKVVEDVKNPTEEISPKEVLSLGLKAALGEDVNIAVDTEDFSRIAAQIAKQIIVQKIREVERTTLFAEFSGKENSLASGSVFRFADRNIIVDLGKAEALMPMSEQVRRERFNVGDRVKVLVLRVERGSRGPVVIVSRSHPDLVKRLLELEVPEVTDKIVEVISVVRDPGFRAKVLVKSNNSKIDPVGTCVGVRGSRIRPVIDELHGERIDLIPWNSETEKFIGASLSPAKVLSVTIQKDDSKIADVLVPDDMLSLAIGKNGQNVRLASKLTGWNINVKSESQKKDDAAKILSSAQKSLADIEGVGPRIADVLIKGGWAHPAKIASATKEQLTALQGIGDKTAEKLIESAKALLEKEANQKEATKPAEEKGKEVSISEEREKGNEISQKGDIGSSQEKEC